MQLQPPASAFDLDASFAELSSLTGLGRDFFKSILSVENPRQDPRARNKNTDGTEDIGLWQINSQHEAFLRKAGIIRTNADLNDPNINTNAAIALFRDLQKQGARTPEQFAAGYNTGKISAIGAPYVGKVIASMNANADTRDNSQIRPRADTVEAGDTPAPPGSSTAGTFELGKNSALITNFLTAATQGLQAGVENARTGAAAIAEIGSNLQTNIIDLGMALSESVRGAHSLKAKNEANMKAGLGTFGLDMEKTDNIISANATEAHALQARHSEELKKYSALSETSFFDNPISWLSAQLALPKQAAVVNNLSKQHASVVNATGAAIQLATSSMQATNLAASTTTAEQAEVLAKAQILQSLESAQKAGLLTEEAKIKLFASIAPLQSQAAQLVMSGVSLDINYANKLYSQWVKAEQLDARAVRDREQAAALQDAKLVADRANVILGTKYTYQQVQKERAIGIIGSLGALGENIPDVIANAKYMADTPETAGARRMVKMIEEDFAKTVAAIERVTPDKKVAAMQAGILVQKNFKAMMDDVSIGTDNPYKGGAPGAILTGNPGLQARIPLLSKVLEPVLGQPIPLDANLIADMAVKTAIFSADGKAAMPNGRALSALAAEISTYHKAVVDNNNRTNRYQTVGLPVQTTYNAKTTGLLGPAQVIDWTNSAAVMSVLLQKAVKQIEVYNSGYEELQRREAATRKAAGDTSFTIPSLPSLPTPVPITEMPPNSGPMFGRGTR